MSIEWSNILDGMSIQEAHKLVMISCFMVDKEANALVVFLNSVDTYLVSVRVCQ